MDECADRETQIRRYLPLVKKVARRIHRLVPSVDLDDLIGDGSVGLIRAVDHFDPQRGTTLEQYARQLIGGAMLNGIRRMDPVSERSRRTLRDGTSERYRIAMERGYMPGICRDGEPAPRIRTRARLQHTAVCRSLSMRRFPEGEAMPSDWSADPAEIMAARERSRALESMLGKLPERQRELVRAHYFGDNSLRDIGTRMRISPQRASQLHLAAIAKLKKAARASTR